MSLKPPGGSNTPRNRPVVLNGQDFGAAIDNSTDDGAAWSAAIAALPAAGGDIFQPRGVSKTSQRIDVSERRNVRIIGEGSDNDAGGFGSTLIYTGTGSSSFIDARNTVGFQMEGFNLLYGSQSFTGKFIDFGDAGGNDTRKGGLTRCLLSGQTGTWTSAATMVDLTNAVDLYFEQTTFMGGTYGVIGRAASTDYSNAHTFNQCKFWNNLTAHVKNAGESWTFITPVIEGLQDDKAGFYTYDSSAFQALTKGFVLIDPWFGDVLATGGLDAQINWAGHGLTIVGGRLGAETATVKGIELGANDCDGIVILGTCGVGPGSPMIDWNGTTGHTGVLIIPGNLDGGMALEAGTRPAGALVMGSSGLLVGDLVLTDGVVANNGEGHQIHLHHSAGAPAVLFGSASDSAIRRLDSNFLGTLASGKFLAAGGLAVGNSAAATEVIGKAVVKKMQVFDETGASIGFVPVYSSIS
jgi:hypothetical protein